MGKQVRITNIFLVRAVQEMTNCRLFLLAIKDISHCWRIFHIIAKTGPLILGNAKLANSQTKNRLSFPTLLKKCIIIR
ncbi:MAG: hypothetical protein COY66_01880 [Candidatus Kerfeldbacteria bacterium CG_4_10_14_0_8_um_filter_42_10]|uniref:Uncharacterized protein n=1 Tax=Candidatus Kerfeldbacteria bacterium CG_4_10_14_0_8_um_filter_42_10 TaxID=2014248 RepID=A0A2M7RK82_9BACT|nr:MAG: hypothetical protein COY66_01880 [Candidatus Kerfeldbacteria bacterium CG_4_10_14_0_8_um_filter_42_10]